MIALVLWKSLMIYDLDVHYHEFYTLLNRTRAYLFEGQAETAAVWAQIASQYAWLNHTGLFSSPELESALREIGSTSTGVDIPNFRTSNPVEVLHVVTQAYQTGGSTQAVASWIEQDRGRHHRVCITRQGPREVPEKVLSRLLSPDDLVRLDARKGGLIQRATMLRRIAMTADVVVLHTHPYDVVPIIAFAGIRSGPPRIYVNHADHVFWLGGSVADVVLHMRDSGLQLATARRGIDAKRSAVLARPLTKHARAHTRDDAKRRLGVDPSQVLLTTVADGTKYKPISSESFLDLVRPAISRHLNAQLLAAGPSPSGAWAVAEAHTNGRIRALGRLPSATILHEAADIYVDSFPFSSLTSLIEAGSLGTPVVTYRGHPEACAVLGADTPGLDELMLRPSTPDAIIAELSSLICDKRRREELGMNVQNAILLTHKGEAWRSGIIRVYEMAAAMQSPISFEMASRETGPLDVLVNSLMAATGYSEGVAGAVRDNLALLPAGQRILKAIEVGRAGLLGSPRHLLPESFVCSVWPWWRLARGIR